MALQSPTKVKFQNGRSPPQSPNGNSRIDVEAELGMQPVRRPMGIDQDVTDLGQRKRVSSVLTSPMFKEELETVVTDLLRSGDGGGHVIAKEIVNMLSPHSMGVGCVSPINDITGSDTARYTKGEKLARCNLAALYRLVDLNGWSMQIYNHISYKVDKEQEHFLINPYGLLYHEVSAAKLLKINMQGEIIDQGATNLPVNKAGFVIHSAIHAGRPDLNCLIHTHVPEVIAVSMMECGLLPISQEACYIGDVSYHPYQGVVIDQKERKQLIKHMGPTNKVMFLRNHGLLVGGTTIEEAFSLLTQAIYACETQVKVLSCAKPEKLIMPDKSARAQVRECDKNQGDIMHSEIEWGQGEMLFEAYMRMLDNMGYRTGYMYKNPTPTNRRPRMNGDIASPATAHGHTIPMDEILEGRTRLHSHPPAARWINSPNQYTKRQPTSEEGHNSVNGDVSPKSRPKRWSRETGSSHSTPIRIADPNQFVPKNTDPREVVEKRKQIRGQGRWDEKGPGPQSQKLEAVQHTDRKGPQQDGVFTGSKGIIQRDYHSQTVVAGPPNPFANMSDEDIEKYRIEVTQTTTKNSESEEDVVTRETIVEHTLEVVAHVDEEPKQESHHDPTPVVTNGHDDPGDDQTMVEEPKQSEEVVDLKPVENRPSQQQQEPVSVNNNNGANISVVETTEQLSPAAKEFTPLEQESSAEEFAVSTEKVEHEDPPKANVDEIATASPAPAAERDVGESAKSPADVKGKHKEHKTKEQKKQKRRSLSFLKKNKEKKDKN